MCLVVFLYGIHTDYRLILAANRDEFYSRPTQPLAFWEDAPSILAGRDLKGGGTWMGITRNGRFSVITNYRNPAEHLKVDARSRGELVSEYLQSDCPPRDYLERVKAAEEQYKGFNLLVGDPEELAYYSNRNGGIKKIETGLYGLSNRILDTPWPKVEKGKAAFEQFLSSSGEISTDAIFDVLSDRSRPSDSQLPDTGVGMEWERTLSPLFITSDVYGTRSSSILMIRRDGHVRFIERGYEFRDEEVVQTHQKSFNFTIAPDAGD